MILTGVQRSKQRERRTLHGSDTTVSDAERRLHRVSPRLAKQLLTKPFSPETQDNYVINEQATPDILVRIPQQNRA